MGHIQVIALPTDSDYGHTDFVFQVGGRAYAGFHAMVWDSTDNAEWARSGVGGVGYTHVAARLFTIIGERPEWLV